MRSGSALQCTMVAAGGENRNRVTAAATLSPPPHSPLSQGELAVKNQELAAAAKEAEKLLHEISESTALAEKEKQKVAVIVDAVTRKVGLAGWWIIGWGIGAGG